MKQKKTLQILLLVFAGLIVLYTGVNLYQKQQSYKEDSDQTMVSDLKSLTSISYNNNGTTLSFIKQNGKWYYTKNKKYPITQSSLESLASTFQKVEAVRELKNADALSDYGLDKPTYTVSVKDKTGKSMTYYIGNATNDSEDSGKVRLSEINEELKNLRKEVRMTVRIEKHSLEIEERLRKAEEQNQNEKRVEHKEKESQEVR